MIYFLCNEYCNSKLNKYSTENSKLGWTKFPSSIEEVLLYISIKLQKRVSRLPLEVRYQKHPLLQSNPIKDWRKCQGIKLKFSIPYKAFSHKLTEVVSSINWVGACLNSKSLEGYAAIPTQ